MPPLDEIALDYARRVQRENRLSAANGGHGTRRERLVEKMQENNYNGFRSPSGNCQCSERHGLLRCLDMDCGDVFDCHPIEVDEGAIDEELET